MPRTAEDVENYLLRLERRFESSGGTFVLSGPVPVAIRVSPPIVAIRVSIGSVPRDPAHQVDVFRRMLEYNASDLMHVSYGVEGDNIVLSAALELENLDLNELEAALSDVDLALARHVPQLAEAAAPRASRPPPA